MLAWRPIGDLSDTSTCIIRDRSRHFWSETDMPHRKPTCLWRPIKDGRVCGVQSQFKLIYLYNFCLFISEKCKDSNKACQSLIRNIRRSLIKHVGLWPRVSDSNESPMGHVKVSDGSPERHDGLRWGMSASNESPIKHEEIFSNQACQSPMGLQWVSNRFPIGLW